MNTRIYEFSKSSIEIYFGKYVSIIVNIFILYSIIEWILSRDDIGDSHDNFNIIIIVVLIFYFLFLLYLRNSAYKIVFDLDKSLLTCHMFKKSLPVVIEFSEIKFINMGIYMKLHTDKKYIFFNGYDNRELLSLLYNSNINLRWTMMGKILTSGGDKKRTDTK